MVNIKFVDFVGFKLYIVCCRAMYESQLDQRILFLLERASTVYYGIMVKLHVNKEKGYKSIAFYRQDCNPKVISEVEVKYENGKAVCVYGGVEKDQHPEFVMYATTKNWKSLAAGDFGFLNMGMFTKMTFKGSKGEAMQFIAPFKAFLVDLGKVPYN